MCQQTTIMMNLSRKPPQMPSMQQNKVNILVQINKVRRNIYTTRIKEKKLYKIKGLHNVIINCPISSY